SLFTLSVDRAGLLRIPIVYLDENNIVNMSLMSQNRLVAAGSFEGIRAIVQPGDYTLLLEADSASASVEISYEILNVDEFEPNESPYLATPIELGTASNGHRLYPTGDQDWFSFEVTAP